MMWLLATAALIGPVGQRIGQRVDGPDRLPPEIFGVLFVVSVFALGRALSRVTEAIERALWKRLSSPGSGPERRVISLTSRSIPGLAGFGVSVMLVACVPMATGSTGAHTGAFETIAWLGAGALSFAAGGLAALAVLAYFEPERKFLRRRLKVNALVIGAACAMVCLLWEGGVIGEAAMAATR